MLGEEVSISDRICLRGKAFTCLRQNLNYHLGTISLAIECASDRNCLRGEAFTCLRQFLTYCLGTISLAMMCCDLRLKSKTVLMF